METLTLLLFASLLLNLFLFRWAIREYTDRRQWQREATSLAHALRDGNGKIPAQSSTPTAFGALVMIGLIIWIGTLVSNLP